MNILLLGDFSSAQYNLKLALQDLGHQVTLISHGDGFKQTPSDIKIYKRNNSEIRYIGAIKEILSQYKISRSLKGFDIVQTASHIFFHNKIDKFLFPKIFEYNNKTVLFHAACSLPYNRFVKTLKYSPCHTCKKFDLKSYICEHEKKDALEFEFNRYEKYNAIVSAHYEYFKAFENTPFRNKNFFIPIPINTSEVNKPINFTPQKLNVYFGETRKGFKGSEVILQAIEKIKKSKYNKYFNFIITSKLPYKEYIQIINDTHIIIDQVNSYSYGVNALVGLSKGKIVLSGAEPEVLNFMGVELNQCPIINILPNVEDIYNKLISLLENKSRIPELSEKGINFVYNYHSPLKIAKEYEKLYYSL